MHVHPFELYPVEILYGISGLLFLCQNAYEKHKEVRAAQGCKIIAKDLEKSLAGLPMFIAHQSDEVELYKVIRVYVNEPTDVVGFLFLILWSCNV